MVSKQTPSGRLRWIIVGIVVLIFVLAVVVSFAILGTSQNGSLTQKDESGKAVATKDEIDRNLTDLKDGIDASVKKQEAAQVALRDDSKQVKLGD